MKNPALKHIPKPQAQKVRTTIYISKQTKMAMKQYVVEKQIDASDYSSSQYIESLIRKDLIEKRIITK